LPIVLDFDKSCGAKILDLSDFCTTQRKETTTMRRKILDQNGFNYLTLTIVDWVDV
jgi:hypothetical protein